MQATVSMKQFVLSHVTSMAVTLSILVGVAIGITALAISNDVATEGVVESARVMPNAYTSLGQGEGFVDAANSRLIAKAPITVFVWDGQGEGLIDGANAREAVAAPVNSFLWDGQIEGLIDGSDRATVQAYRGFGPGEGLIDPTNRAPEPDVLMAYPSPGQGEGLIGPGGLTE